MVILTKSYQVYSDREEDPILIPLPYFPLGGNLQNDARESENSLSDTSTTSDKSTDWPDISVSIQSLDPVPTGEQWVAVTVGRKPGVFLGV